MRSFRGRYGALGGGVNPAIASSIVDLVGAGVQVGGALAAQKQQGAQQQRQLEQMAAMDRARSYAVVPKASGLPLILGGLSLLLVAGLGAFVLMSRRRRRR